MSPGLFNKNILSAVVIMLSCLLSTLLATAQTCPVNIDFEKGTFEGWTCYVGSVDAAGDENIISLYPSNPTPGRHTMYTAGTGGFDPYGNFPVTAPNGSGHSIRLGNTQGGGLAEGVSYQFTIPANQNSYSITYNYAVVFQEPRHRPNEQPRMEIEITNITDNKVIDCASFTFIALGSSLPGFQTSNIDTIPVLYKDWSTVSVDLSGNAGKTIRLFFKTADCTFIRHFGYAYIDVESECSNSIMGSVYCPDDTAVTVTAPYGYQSYTWYDSTLTQVLSTSQTLKFVPPPPSGTTVAVSLEPYPGFGCPQTLFAKLFDTLTVKANAGKDTLSCSMNPVPIGTTPRSSFVYSWTPETGLSNAFVANPMASPAVTTSYVVRTSSTGGGCVNYDTVVVKASVVDTSLEVIGKTAFCLGYGDSAILKVKPQLSIQWYKNSSPLIGATQTSYRVNSAGNYSAILTDTAGCKLSTRRQNIIIDEEKPGIRYPLKYAIENIDLPLSARKIGETALWRPSTNLNTTASFTPVYKGVREQLYTIEIKTLGGCITVDTQLVKTVKGVEIYVPTAFTPNSDGLNDQLRPILRGVKELHYFRIFNRWGQLMYQSNSTEQAGWDGRYEKMAQQTETIVWVLECVGLDGVVYLKKGSTVLIR